MSSLAVSASPSPSYSASQPAQGQTAQQWLAQHPGATAQDIINWGYDNGGNTYAGAAEFLQKSGIDINHLVENRGAAASSIIGGAQGQTAKQWLAQHPGATAQDIINWGYDNGQDTYNGAADFLQPLGIDINKLVENRGAAASSIISGAKSSDSSSEKKAENSSGTNAKNVKGNAKMKALAADGLKIANNMHSSGLCATGVNQAINETYGLNIHGDGNQVDNRLEEKGWKKANLSLQDALKIPGVVLVWETTNCPDGQIYGHTAISQGDGHSSTSDHLDNDTVASTQGATGFSAWVPPDAVV
jgi:hypothetical protein